MEQEQKKIQELLNIFKELKEIELRYSEAYIERDTAVVDLKEKYDDVALKYDEKLDKIEEEFKDVFKEAVSRVKDIIPVLVLAKIAYEGADDVIRHRMVDDLIFLSKGYNLGKRKHLTEIYGEGEYELVHAAFDC
jgi:hypothetical protein